MPSAMLDYLLTISMIVVALSHLILQWHCSTWQKERRLMTEHAADWGHRVKMQLECLDEAVITLGDIADILDSSPRANDQNSEPLNVGQLFTQAIMSNFANGQNHASEETQRTVYEAEEFGSPKESIQ